MKTPEVMKIDDVARYLKISRRSVYRLAQAGEIPARKIVNRWRFHRGEIEEWLRRKGERRS